MKAQSPHFVPFGGLGGATITLASIIKQLDPAAGTLDFALCNNLNDTSTITSRGFSVAPGAAPSGITAYRSGAAAKTSATMRGAGRRSDRRLPA